MDTCIVPVDISIKLLLLIFDWELLVGFDETLCNTCLVAIIYRYKLVGIRIA